MMRVYLAGPINGCSDSEAIDWREETKRALPHVTFVDPMARDYRGREDEAVNEIVENDKADILSCDVVLAFCPRPSYGTAMEILFAYENYVPVIAVVPDGPVSPWVRYHAAVLRSLGEAHALLR